MRRAITTCVRLFAETFRPGGPVVEVGSLYPPGYRELVDLRPHFEGLQYVGCDIRLGLGVDLNADANALCFAKESVRTVVLCEILEHLPRPERAISEAFRVLQPDGVLVLSVPFSYRLHGFPTDYWRFTASGIYLLLCDFADKIVFAVGPRLKPAFIFAVAGKGASSDFVENRSRFQSLVQEAFRKSRFQGHMSVFKERARDLLGHLLGRAEVSVVFFDPEAKGGYEASPAEWVRKDEAQEHVV
jgi:SAM-dependent methyltransferase